MPKLNLDDLDDLFTVRTPMRAAPSAPFADKPLITVQCIICEHTRTFVQFDEHRPDPLPLCGDCLSATHTTLDILERRVVDAEEQLASAITAFDQILATARPDDQARYTRILTERRKGINDQAHWQRVERATARARDAGDGLSTILNAEAQRNEVAEQAGTAMAELTSVIGTLLYQDAAAGWQIPDDVTARRLALGQPGSPDRPQVAHIPEQIRLLAA